MAVRTKEEIMDAIKMRVGDDMSDEAIALIEDISDTYDDLTDRAAGFNELSSRYNELDNEWRARYTARFFETPSGEKDVDPIPEIDEPDPEEDEITTFDGLFTEVK